MKFNELKDGQVLWAAAPIYTNNIMIVLQKGERAVTVFWYDSAVEECKRTTLFEDEWKDSGHYTRWGLNKKFKIDSQHSQNIINELFEYYDIAKSF